MSLQEDALISRRNRLLSFRISAIIGVILKYYFPYLLSLVKEKANIGYRK